MPKDKIKIVILAAGKGKRMRSEEPKALVNFQGRPFLEHIIATVRQLDEEIEMIIVIGHKKERIRETLGENYTYAEQTEQLGTGHALMSAKKAIESEHKTVLVLATDQPLVSKETLENIITRHSEKNPTITMGTVTVTDFEDWRKGMYTDFGRIIRGTDGKIKKIIEFKDATPEEKKVKELNPALYAFEANWLWQNIDKLNNENAQGEYYITDLVKLACEQNQKIESVPIADIKEALQPNSKEELEILERLMVK